MERIDRDGLLLCELQAKAFELSVSATATSSDIFVRRFMNSRAARLLDTRSILETNLHARDILDRVEEQYGPSEYGKIKYTEDEMFWIGYIYRYFVYANGITSPRAYKIIKPKELRGLFLPYHTLEPMQAIERILEAKGLPLNEAERLQRQYEIFRKIRQSG